VAIRQPRYNKEEFARRGDEIYESQVRQQVEEGNYGKIVAIDLETGDFEVELTHRQNLIPWECTKKSGAPQKLRDLEPQLWAGKPDVSMVFLL
jgi:hypothetical protein